MIMNNFRNVICRSFLVLAFVAGGTIFSFASDRPGEYGPSPIGVTLVDIWNLIFPGGEFLPETPQAASDDLQITLRDSVTGKRVQGRISFTGVDASPASIVTDVAGRGSFHLATGFNDLEVAAPGYHALNTHFEAGQSALGITVWLDPKEIPREMRPSVIESNLRPGSTLIYGHIIDESGKPVADARVYLEDAKVDAISDRRGYFRMSVPTPPIVPAGELPGTDDLVVESHGKVICRRNNILLPDGAIHFIIDIDRGGPVLKDDTHKLRLSPEELKNTQTGPPPAAETHGGEPDQPSNVTVPTSIRVGSSCPTRTTCSVFQVYSLDAYVRLGLDDEWISSWNANSLKAGAIAFRSYGVYFVFHPLTANYDICNTTSCQVMDPSDSAASTDNATAQTTGSIVVDSTGNNPFFAEYAAENNDSACPDGFTGNNSTWPCMSDAVDAGQTFNGHGRGMCQWGTQRWSVNQGKDFVWIVNHYYNNNGNPSGLRAGYLQIGPGTLLPPPTLAAPGLTTAPGTAIVSLTPTFEWQPVDGADGYSLYISKFNGSTYDLIFNSETTVGQPLTGASYALPGGFLQLNGQYRWNMSSHSAAGYGTANTFRNYFYISAPASVSGRVFTSDGVRGLRNATVSITDPQGVKRTVTTSSFGFYSFDSLATGLQYTINISSRLYRFQPLTIQVSGDLRDVDLVGLE